MIDERAIVPGVFVGTLRHRRFTPVSHVFSYDLFMVLVDIDRIPELMRVSWLTSANRPNWAVYDDRDHFGDPALPLRDRLCADAARHGVAWPDGPVYLLTNLRYLNYCFNPISLFYCFDGAGRLAAVVAEVRNTFGGACNYWLTPDADAGGTTLRARAAKSLYVSPFMAPDVDYSFALTRPDDRLVAHIRVSKERNVIFDATLRLARRPWTAAEIRRALVRFPWMTAKVITAIHWQALLLWARGMKVVPRRTATGAGEREACS